MDLQMGYLSEVSSRDSLWVFYILGYIFQNNRRQVFKILNYRSSLLCLVLSGFPLSLVYWLILRELLSIQYSGNSIAKVCYQVSIIRHHSKIYTAGSAEDVYIPVIIQLTWEPYLQ